MAVIRSQPGDLSKECQWRALHYVPMTRRTRSLVNEHPAIAAQWHPDLNADVNLAQIGPGSHKAVFWQCDDGHVWQARVHNGSPLLHRPTVGPRPRLSPGGSRACSLPCGEGGLLGYVVGDGQSAKPFIGLQPQDSSHAAWPVRPGAAAGRRTG
jgi:hypothetical protein